MKKIDPEFLNKLQAAGQITPEGIAELEKTGNISARRHNNKKYVLTEQLTIVSPEIIFKGIGKDKYSKAMLDMKAEITAVIAKFAMTLSEASIAQTELAAKGEVENEGA